MKILESYVLRSFIGAFFFCITLLIVVGIIGDILGFIDEIFKKNIPLSSILSFYIYLAPFAFVNMIPFACLLSTIYVFNSLSKNHEVTAVIASGVSLWKLLRPVLLATFILCLATFIINDKFVPSSMEKANSIKQNELESAGSKKNKEMKNLAIYGKGNQLIYVKAFVPATGTLKNVIIHKQNEDNIITEKISASTVQWTGDGWVGKDIIKFKMSPEGSFSNEPAMIKKENIYIAETPEDFSINQWDPRFMSFHQLREYIKLFGNDSKDTVRRLLVDLNYKLAFPFTALITVLIGAPFSIETGRASPLIGMARGITIAILYLPVMAISLALGKGGSLPPFISAWLAILIFTGAGIYYVNRKS